MGRRVIGVIAAAILAIVGTAALVSYVRSAADRERAGEERISILLASEFIAAGTPVEAIGPLVVIDEVPSRLVAAGAMANLDELEGQVVEADIFAGEQVLSQHFVPPSGFLQRDPGVEIPPNMLEVSISLSGPQILGGAIVPGNRVAILATFQGEVDQPQIVQIEGGEVVPVPDDDDDDEGQEAFTTILLRNVLVTGFQEGGAGAFSSQLARSQARLTTPPGGGITITVALSPGNTERLVFAAQNSTLWAALEHPDVTLDDGPIRTLDNILNEEG